MNISEYNTLTEHSDRCLNVDTINIQLFWKRLYNGNYIQREVIDNKIYIIVVSKHNDYTSNPLDIEEYILDLNNTLILKLSTNMDNIPTKGLSKIFHRKERKDITTLNKELDKLKQRKVDIWDRLLVSGSLPL